MPILRATFIIAALFFAHVATSQDLVVDVEAAKQLISEWNDAHSATGYGNLTKLYAGTVIYYGSVLERSRCMTIKRALLRKNEDYHQALKGDLALTAYASGVVRADFIKTVTIDGKAEDYHAYLVVKEVAGRYLIVGESDLVTDRRIRHVPDLGLVVAIKQGKLEPVSVEQRALNEVISKAKPIGAIVVTALMAFIVVLLFRGQLKFRRLRRPPPDYAQMGVEFEKFIVQKFAEKKDFTLVEWRGDKYHEGIYPESNRNPDMEYKFQMGGFTRSFAIECKFRNRRRSSFIPLMDQRKYLDYELFHKHKMPVYIALGYGGKPANPSELYLIPFGNVKKEMSRLELSKYRKSGPFYYDVNADRLT